MSVFTTSKDITDFSRIFLLSSRKVVYDIFYQLQNVMLWISILHRPVKFTYHTKMTNLWFGIYWREFFSLKEKYILSRFLDVE